MYSTPETNKKLMLSQMSSITYNSEAETAPASHYGGDESTPEQSNQVRLMVQSSLATAGAFILEWLPSVITLYFLSQSDKTHGQIQVGGYGFGLVWFNCFGIGIVYGLSCGLETVASHAFGAKRLDLMNLL